MIDLHLHSNASDGTDAPSELVRLAYTNGCRTLALTDHDTLEGVDEARKAAIELGIELISAVEVSVRSVNSGGIHSLIYFLDRDTPLGEELARLRRHRVERNAKMIERMRSDGIEIDYAGVRAHAGSDNIGRPHFAAFLVAAGRVSSIQQAFDEYFGSGQRYYIPKDQLTAGQLVDLATQSGAVVCLAHPFREMKISDTGVRPESALQAVRTEVEYLASLGYSGVEAYYSMHSAQERDYLINLAQEFDLVPTGGSDYHGTIKPGLSPGKDRFGGSLNIPESTIEGLLAARDRLL